MLCFLLLFLLPSIHNKVFDFLTIHNFGIEYAF